MRRRAYGLVGVKLVIGKFGVPGVLITVEICDTDVSSQRHRISCLYQVVPVLDELICWREDRAFSSIDVCGVCFAFVCLGQKVDRSAGVVRIKGMLDEGEVGDRSVVRVCETDHRRHAIAQVSQMSVPFRILRRTLSRGEFELLEMSPRCRLAR